MQATQPLTFYLNQFQKTEEDRLTEACCKFFQKLKAAKSKVVCDALMLDESSQSDTYPTMEVGNSSADLEHEASVSKVSDSQLFYLMSRGLNEEQTMGMIVNGFFEPFTKELPMEYASELNKLLNIEMEGFHWMMYQKMQSPPRYNHLWKYLLGGGISR